MIEQCIIQESLEQAETISKKEAMALTGLAETHLTRYLKTGVIEAYKLPGYVANNRGEWLVLKSSCVEFIKIRKSGKLKQFLNSNPEYIKLRNRLTKQVRELRQAGRLENQDPLTDPQSEYHKGCFTVKQVASHCQVPTQTVYEHIKSGRVEAESVLSGGRLRYGIAPAEAKRYAAWAKGREFTTPGQREINRAGLLSVKDLEARWSTSKDMIYRHIKDNRLKARRFGRYWAFEMTDVRRFERDN